MLINRVIVYNKYILTSCHNDVIDAGQNNRLFCPCTAMDRERLHLSHAKRNVLRTNMWSIFLSTYDSVNKDKDSAENGIIIFNDRDSTVGELRNPEDIGVAEMNMHLGRFVISARTKLQDVFHWDSSSLPYLFVMLSRLSRFLTCHNDVIDAGQNNRLFSPCTAMDREHLHLQRVISPDIKVSFFILSLSLFTMSSVDKKIYLPWY
jgi:hypothetical protein